MDTIGKLVLAFVTLIIGAVLIAQVATTGATVTTKNNVDNELKTLTAANPTNAINTTVVYTVTNNPTTWKVQDCPLTSFAVKNASGGTAFTVTTDYVPTLSTGTFTMQNTVNTNTTSHINQSLQVYVDYIYCPDDYVNSSWGRTAVDLVPGFFALALLVASVGLFYSVARDQGIIA